MMPDSVFRNFEVTNASPSWVAAVVAELTRSA